MVCKVLLWYDRMQRNHFSKDLLSFLVGLLWSSSSTMNLPLKLLSIPRVLWCHPHWGVGSGPRVQGCLMENGSAGYSQGEDWILVKKILWDQTKLTRRQITARSSRRRAWLECWKRIECVPCLDYKPENRRLHAVRELEGISGLHG